ncbi:bifunctional acyl-ACP--phospholipid O-acyltransferase/long-chain-fatty-acid--ACP ligase [Candidatus Magnetaquicoccus inordinatus]|uniref:bifunctional acyl-ACP--phospholipid O-acyltransferase/long-chain-fatty-acid--ACP ligase n=1 Tax=Candidatus Magnetaquicoccus inordinatus TaxID=2496818 RepID=UPI00102CBB32|nr:bifunctional acyl-ACP--phospholipid O-acyltransferase/long-chain-fatty-acid--ACP ligase [Candidatus Magnetaquicoccus inordinatus]
MKSILRFLFRLLTRLLFRVEVRGANTALNAQRLLIIANHESFLDGLLLSLYLPLDPVIVVHTSVLRSFFFRMLLSQVEILAVDSNNPMAMKKVIRLLESGRPVMIFPEGRITVTGNLMKVYEGPAFAAAKSGAAILPVRLHGTAWSYFSRLRKPFPRRLLPKITLTLLPLTHLPMPEAATAKLRRRKAGQALQRLMQEMLFATAPYENLYSSFCDAISLHGRQTRIIEDLKQIEYRYQDLLKMALVLTRLVERATPEVKPGDRIGLLLPNLAVTVALLLGLTARRRTPALLNYTAGREGMQAACTAATLTTVITSHAFVEQAKLSEKLAALQGVRLLYLEDLRETITLADKIWLLGYGLWQPRRFALPCQKDDPAVVLFTSGSEGTPKGVVLSHRALLANLAQIGAVVDFSPNDKILNALPIFHSFGLSVGALMPLLTGTPLFLYPSPLHYRVIPETAYDRACTVLFGTNTFLANYGKFAHPYDFFRMRFVIAGAEKLTENVRNLWFEKFGLRIMEGYGATETAPVLATNTPMAYRSGTVGQFLPGIDWKLEQVPGIEEGGMLQVQAPNLFSGYLKVDLPGQLQPPSCSAGAGWYETGDLVTVDDEGFVRIIGRVKRFAKVAGEMISLESVEKIAFAASPERLHAASSQPDANKGEALVLFTTDRQLNREQLLLTARNLGSPELAVPRKISHLEALPLLGTGKIDYVTLKQMAENL